MKLLQLVNRIPYPLNDGGNLAVYACTEGFLQAGVSVSMLAMNTVRHHVAINELPGRYKQLEHFKAIDVDNRVKPLAAFLNLFKGSSYNIERFISREYKTALIDLLKKEAFDIIQLEGLFLVPYIKTIRKYSKAKVVLRQHNIEFRIWERLAAQTPNPVKKFYLHLLAARLKKFELRHLNDYDLILPISEEDGNFMAALGTQVPLFFHPFSVEADQIAFLPSDKQPLSLYHIGAMDWRPNQESVNWLLEKVMPAIQLQLPQTKLYLAGRNMPEYYSKNHWPNVTVLGEVPDALSFERDKSILVVPLLSGGGVRIKIFQAMAMGKTIITTSIGLEGIDAQDGIQVMVADDPQTFIDKIIKTVQNPEIIQDMGKAARNLIEEKYDRKKRISDLLKRYETLSKTS